MIDCMECGKLAQKYYEDKKCPGRLLCQSCHEKEEARRMREQIEPKREVYRE